LLGTSKPHLGACCRHMRMGDRALPRRPSVARFATPRVPSQSMTHLPTRPLGALGMRPARGF
jgi:hypothetical protein